MDEFYTLTLGYPPDEKFGLTAETRKTARSVPYNIAEGRFRRGAAEYHHGVSIALGSVGELWTQALIAGRRKYITPATQSDAEARLAEVACMLRALEMALRR